ncbi:TPA: tail fiber assembly protein [Enterobacter roggenkampii]|uniref:tail fiber assembly protein n=1 Tax=Enterobacter roggenkampii TaxID=1812935 RepID=UPI000460A91B|nr:tail fiber assembly protein [Enterobacter roggenkampii]KDF62861.1 hypothetical protein AF40_01641 [Enterobacter roggenkampii MGH 54]
MTVSRYALVKNNAVENIVAWDGDGDLFSEYLTVELAEETPCSVGWNYDGKDFTPPPEPEKTHAELVVEAEQQKTALLAGATAIIAPMADAQAGGYIEDSDVPRLAEWQRYRYKLTKVDTSTAPEISWPEPPAV